ncbi:unnamed protein product, partial [Rotaria sp. Silwood1]
GRGDILLFISELGSPSFMTRYIALYLCCGTIIIALYRAIVGLSS